jgi:HSP20 family protein
MRRGAATKEIAMGEKNKEVETRKEGRSLSSWRPFEEFERWTGGSLFPGRMGRLLDELSREWPAGHGRAFLPAVDVAENDSNYTVTVELPGASKDDVHVELNEGILTIHGEKKSEREEKKERSRYVERSYGSFTRSFTLPRDADGDRLSASFKDGVLTITVPRSEAAKPRTIAIKE